MNDGLTSQSQNIFRKSISGVIFACLVMSIIIFSFDSGELKEIIEQVHWQSLLLAGILAVCVYAGRFFKWMLFCNVLSISIPWLDNLLIFISGLALGITPGKVGEVLKCYILKRKYSIDFSYTSPTIIGERLSGVLGCFILCLATLFYHGLNSSYSFFSGICVGFIVVIILFIFRSESFSEWIFFKLSKIKIMNNRLNDFKSFYDSTVNILGLKVLVIAVLISIVYWFCECMIFFSLLDGLGIKFTVSQAVLILTATSIGSGLTMLPGSVGALEGGLIGVLVFYGVDMSLAGGVVILHRFFAMWDVLIIGWLVLIVKRHDFFIYSINNMHGE